MSLYIMTSTMSRSFRSIIDASVRFQSRTNKLRINKDWRFSLGSCNTVRSRLRPFHLTTVQKICHDGRELVLRVMKLDPREMPSARQLLQDR
ncbi:hypothetical protein BJX96DRAFT_89571 [Aspergillus floccosus]